MSKRHMKGRMRQWIKHQWMHGRPWIECHYCGARLTFDEITLDHITPFSRGGSDYIGNLLPACKTCNQKRADRAYPDFVRECAA